MNHIMVTITRWIDDSQPGWVECALRDAWGQEYLFHEKAPVVSAEDIDDASAFPRPGFIGCEVMERFQDEQGRSLVKVSTEKPWAIESTIGENRFDVLPEQLELL